MIIADINTIPTACIPDITENIVNIVNKISKYLTDIPIDTEKFLSKVNINSSLKNIYILDIINILVNIKIIISSFNNEAAFPNKKLWSPIWFGFPDCCIIVNSNIPNPKNIDSIIAIAESSFILDFIDIVSISIKDNHPVINAPIIRKIGFLVPDIINAIHIPGNIEWDKASPTRDFFFKNMKEPIIAELPLSNIILNNIYFRFESLKKKKLI